MAGATIVHLPVSRLATLNETLANTLISAINLCLDLANHPLYVHCLDGRRIASLFVILMRRIQGWTPLPSLSEYWRYQVSNRTPIPTAEVEKTTKDLEKFCAECTDVALPLTSAIPKWLWLGDRTAVVHGVRVKAPATGATSTGTTSAAAAAADRPTATDTLSPVAGAAAASGGI